MKLSLDKSRTVIIHDFDGVHYDYAEHPDLYGYLGLANAMAALGLYPSLTLEQAKIIAIESYQTHHNGFSGFLPHKGDSELSDQEIIFMHSRAYHKVGYDVLVRDYPDYICPCPDMLAYFRSLKGMVRHCLLTQSDMEHWAKPCLDSMGYTEHYDALLGFEECNGEYKFQSTHPVSLALSVMRAAPEHAIFMEDSLRNMEKAKELGNILNVYVHHGRPLEALPDYVDLQVDKPRDLMWAVHEVMQPAMRRNASAAHERHCDMS